jgi:hypothetical protein
VVFPEQQQSVPAEQHGSAEFSSSLEQQLSVLVEQQELVSFSGSSEEQQELVLILVSPGQLLPC